MLDVTGEHEQAATRETRGERKEKNEKGKTGSNGIFPKSNDETEKNGDDYGDSIIVFQSPTSRAAARRRINRWRKQNEAKMSDRFFSVLAFCLLSTSLTRRHSLRTERS